MKGIEAPLGAGEVTESRRADAASAARVGPPRINTAIVDAGRTAASVGVIREGAGGA